MGGKYYSTVKTMQRYDHAWVLEVSKSCCACGNQAASASHAWVVLAWLAWVVEDSANLPTLSTDHSQTHRSEVCIVDHPPKAGHGLSVESERAAGRVHRVIGVIGRRQRSATWERNWRRGGARAGCRGGGGA